MISIETDLKNWSQQVLEVPNPALKGLPACPYAKQAWKDKKVKVVETSNVLYSTRVEASVFKNSTYELVVVASYDIPFLHIFNSYVDDLNNGYKNLHFMGFHPEYGAEEAQLDFLYEHDWESGIDKDYCMIFIQYLDQVDDASQKLEKLGYYDVYPKEEYEALVLDRRKRRKTNGNET
tara:strand:+ start:445 stop:978 length:534 start_codon:yes stop_codon:yes gene_type:complete